MNTVMRTWGRTLLVLGGSLAVYVGTALLATLATGDPLAGAMSANLTAAVLAIGYRLFTAGHLRASQSLPVAKTGMFWAVVGVTLLACWFAGQSASVLAYQAWGSDGFDAVSAARATGPVWMMVAAMVVFAPIGEESLLRGIAYPELRRHWPVAAAAVVTAVVFALLHGNIVQIVLTVPLGIVLAYVYEACRRLWPVIALHAAFNALALVMPVQVVAALANPVAVSMLAIAFVLALCVMHFVVTQGAGAEQDSAVR